MKKILGIIIGLVITAPFAFGYFEQTLNLNVISENKLGRNYVVEYQSKQYVIHYNGSCGDAVRNDRLTVNVRSILDGIEDYIIKNSYTKCEIDQAEVITDTLNIDGIHGTRSFATVSDKDGKYDISYSSQCNDMGRYEGGYVYIRKFGSYLNKGDIIYLPRKEGICPILYIDKWEEDEEKEVVDPAIDIKMPNKVYNVNAIPGNGKVYLNWRAAYDNVGIDHYIISYSQYSFNTREYEVKDMPNQIVTEDTHLDITDLRNENTYYFYVIAVDTSGNYGTLWSYEEKAMPRSSISIPAVAPSSIKIEKIQETSLSFLFKWNKIENTIKQNVSLMAYTESEFFLRDWAKDYVRVLKKDTRKGKKLILKVRVYYGSDRWQEAEYEFSF